MAVVPNFVPRQELTSSPDLPSPHSRPYFLFVGRLEKIKGADSLLSIFDHYRHADLLIVGTGTYEADLRRRAKGMTHVHFLGALPLERIRDFYRHAIAVLVPSICYEVFGLIVVEAYQQRIPVIAHALGGLTELVEQSQGGFLYHNPDELLAAMERLRTDPALRREMGDRGYQMFEERWSESAHLETYFGLIEETARRKLGSVPWDQQARPS